MKALLHKDCSISRMHLQPGEIKTEACRSAMLFIALEGVCSFSINGSLFTSLEAGCITLVPDKSCYVVSAAEETHLLVYGVEDIMDLWEGSFPERFSKAYNYSDPRFPYVIRLNGRLREYCEQVCGCIDDGLTDVRFMRIKTFELIHLLRFYCPAEELFDFMYPVANENCAFIKIVLDNWKQARSKDDLASFTGLSASRFGVKFKQVFGVSPYKWILERRSEEIIYRLSYTNDSLRKIREELHFCSAQHFNDFCKKQFGNSPGKIRSENRKIQAAGKDFPAGVSK